MVKINLQASSTLTKEIILSFDLSSILNKNQINFFKYNSNQHKNYSESLKTETVIQAKYFLFLFERKQKVEKLMTAISTVFVTENLNSFLFTRPQFEINCCIKAKVLIKLLFFYYPYQSIIFVKASPLCSLFFFYGFWQIN